MIWIRSSQRAPKWYPLLTPIETTKVVIFLVRSVNGDHRCCRYLCVAPCNIVDYNTNCAKKYGGGGGNISKMLLKVMTLLETIEDLRYYLNQIASTRKLTDPEVVKVSQRLDQLLNEYNSCVLS